MNSVKRNRTIDLLAQKSATPMATVKHRIEVNSDGEQVTVAPSKQLSPVKIIVREPVPFPLPTDPRPDLINDSRLWDALCKAQYAVDGEKEDGLYGLLHGLRCCGAQIKSDPKFRYVLDKGEIGDTEWNGEQSINPTQPNNGYRGSLLPYRARLTILLRNLP